MVPVARSSTVRRSLDPQHPLDPQRQGEAVGEDESLGGDSLSVCGSSIPGPPQPSHGGGKGSFALVSIW